VKQYETTAIITPVLSEDGVKQAIEGYVDLLKREGSEIVHIDNWGLKQLAYPINKKTTGIYVIIEFKTNSNDVVDKLELAYRRDDSVMRYLTIALDKYSIQYNIDRRSGKIGKPKKIERVKKEDFDI
jgi:small subunit ribosomal protein S6